MMMQALNLQSKPSTTAIILLLLIVQLITQQATSSSSSSNTASSSYTSITQLDKYGSSAQIKNARLASQLYGATTIAAIATSSSTTTTTDDDKNNNSNNNNNEYIIVVSREKQTPGVLQNQNNNHKLQILANNPSSSTSTTTALIGSGLKSDITFLTNLLRKHASYHWERYDSIPTSHRMAQSAGLVLQAFHGYERGSEVGDGVPDVLLGDDGKKMRLGRPLAASLLLVDVVGSNNESEEDGSSSSSSSSRATMVAVDPSGVVSEPLVAFGLGRGGDKANEMLGKRWRPDLSVKEVEDICIGILRDIVALEEEKEGKGGRSAVHDKDTGVGLNKDDGGEMDYIVCEILSKDGWSTKRLRLAKDIVS